MDMSALKNVELLDQELKFSFLCNLLEWTKGVWAGSISMIDFVVC